MPDLFIITGSNGAGKSTIGPVFLPDTIREHYKVFDGDKLYMQHQRVLWESGIKAIKEAKKIALEFVSNTFDFLIESALANNDTFVYEGHFTNDETWKIPANFKEKGYTINLLFLGLDDTELSQSRVRERVKSGGHHVPQNTIADNFYGNLEKLNKYYYLIDNLSIIDTSQASHVLLASFSNQILTSSVPYADLPLWFIQYLPQLADKIK